MSRVRLLLDRITCKRRFQLATPPSIRQLAIAIYTVNRHAKTAPDNKKLYDLKKLSLDKLIQDGQAKKIGLHFVETPKHSKQHSTTLVQCSDFLFHMIPEKEDFNNLPHLGHQDQASRNPQERMSLRMAKSLLADFTGTPSEIVRDIKRKPLRKPPKKMNNKSDFRSSYLDG